MLLLQTFKHQRHHSLGLTLKKKIYCWYSYKKLGFINVQIKPRSSIYADDHYLAAWQQLCYQTQTCKYVNLLYKHCSSYKEVFPPWGGGAGNVGRLCVGLLYPSLRCKNVLTVHKHIDSTWKRMSQLSQVDKKKEKAAEYLPKEICSWKPPIWYLNSPHRSFKELALSISCGMRTLLDDVL